MVSKQHTALCTIEVTYTVDKIPKKCYIEISSISCLKPTVFYAFLFAPKCPGCVILFHFSLLLSKQPSCYGYLVEGESLQSKMRGPQSLLRKNEDVIFAISEKILSRIKESLSPSKAFYLVSGIWISRHMRKKGQKPMSNQNSSKELDIFFI